MAVLVKYIYQYTKSGARIYNQHRYLLLFSTKELHPVNSKLILLSDISTSNDTMKFY
jgi:hypothetical protein